jgi:hypothetical protein
MQSLSNDNFGPLVAYLVPGATALWGMSEFSPEVRSLFAISASDAPTIGGFLYLTLLSLGIGMTVTAIRWVIVDSLHRITGLKPPILNFAHLHERTDAFALLIEIHYRHYQFYSNMFIATAIVYLCYGLKSESLLPFGAWTILLFVLEAIFLVTSRDTLSKYFIRSQQLLSTSQKESITVRKPVTRRVPAPSGEQTPPIRRRARAESSAAE